MIDVISDTRDGLLIAVYSYQYYSRVSIEALVSTTPCRGNLNFKHLSKNLILVLFIWLFQLRLRIA